MPKYFSDTRVHDDGSLTLSFKHDIKQPTRIRIAKRIEKKGKRKVSLYSDGRLEVFGNPKPSKRIQTKLMKM